MSVEIKLNQEETSYKTMPEVLADAKAGDTISITMQDNDILTGGNNNNGAGTALNYNITGGTVSGNVGTKGGGFNVAKGQSFIANGVLFDSNTGIKNGNWTGGGAIGVEGNGIFIVTDSKFKNNKSTGDGGAMRTFGGSIEQSVFTNNSGGHGGAIINGGGALVLKQVTFRENNASETGGAIRIQLGNLTINGSAENRNCFDGNGAKLGGAIYYNQISGMPVSFTDFISNKAVQDGGAVYASTNTNSNTTPHTYTNCTFTGNSASNNGGAIFNGWYITLEESIFTGNTATLGGAIYNTGTINITGDVSFITELDTIYNTGTVNFSNTNTVNASISGSDTAVFNVLENATLIFDNTTDIELAKLTLAGKNALTFTGSASVGFTGLVLTGVTISVSGENYTGSDTKIATGISGTLDDNYQILYGDKNHFFYLDVKDETLWLKKYDITISRIDAEGNTLGSYHDILTAQQNVAANTETIKIVMGKNVISHGNKDANGKDISVNYDISGGTFSNNTASSQGGVLTLCAGQTMTVDNVLFANNSVTAAEAWNGGGALSSGKYTTAGTVNVSNSVFKENHSAKNGGAFANISTSNTFTDTQFIDNTASEYGGAITIRGGWLNLSGVAFNGNKSQAAEGELGGGAIYLMLGNITISASEKNSNSFIDNISKTVGGAISVDNAAGKVNISSAYFAGNSAETLGGAIYADKGTITLTGNTYSGNTAKTSGGALYFTSNITSAEISGNTFCTQSDTIFNDGKLTFKDENIINADVSGNGTFKVAENAVLTFNNTVEINIAALTIEVADSNTINLNGKVVKFTGLDAGTVAITVDGTGLEAGTVIATGVTGTIGADDIVSNVEKGYLDIVGNDLVLKIKTDKDGVLAENSTGSVYGGGSAANDGTDITQTIASGLKQGTVFAGSQTGFDSVITTTVSGGSIQKNLYGGGKVSADTTNLTISGGTVDMIVYGGIYVTSALNTAGNLGNANLTITDGTFNHYLSGGSRVDAFDTTTTHTTGTVNLILKGGEFTCKGSNSDPGTTIYGAGYLKGTGAVAENVQYQVTTSNVTIDGASITGAVYGGAFSYNKGLAQVDEANVTVESGSVDRVFGGGWAQDNGISNVVDVNITVKETAVVGTVYAGGVNASGGKSEVTGSVAITVTDTAAVNTIFMGGRYNNSLVSGDVTVTISGADKEFARISGDGAYLKNTGTSSLVVDAIVKVAALDGIDKLTITDGSTLNLTEADFTGLTEICFDLEDAKLDTADWTVLTGVSLDNFNEVKFMVDDTEMILADGAYISDDFKVFEENNTIKFAKIV